MKRLLRLAARLYPPAWRRRYGDEFDAMLEDITPRWTDVVNVAGKALTTRVMNSLLLLPVTCACIALLGVWLFDVSRPALYGAKGVVAIQGVGPQDGQWAAAVRTALAENNVLAILNRHDVYSQWYLTDGMRLQRYRQHHGVILSRTAEIDVWFNDPDPRLAQAVARDLTALITGAEMPPGQKLVVLRAPEVRGPGKLPMYLFGGYRYSRDVFGLAALAGALVGLVVGVIRRARRRTPLSA